MAAAKGGVGGVLSFSDRRDLRSGRIGRRQGPRQLCSCWGLVQAGRRECVSQTKAPLQYCRHVDGTIWGVF
jgi:hypothetical protein